MKPQVLNIAFTLGLLQSIVSTTITQSTQNQATFATKLFSTISQEETNQNVFISPASIQTALALAFIGAEGKTATELIQGLHLGSNSVSKEEVTQQFENLLKKMRKSDNATVKMANRIFIKTGSLVAHIFNRVAQENFTADIEIVNFADKKNTILKMNNWLQEHTVNKIRNLISPDLLDEDTAALLLNTIYFKATWLQPFDSRITTRKDFYLNETSTKKVDMMRKLHPFAYAELSDLNAKVLSMRYVDTNIQMLVLLPNELDGLSQLEQKLKAVDLTKVLNSLKIKEVQISLPKFKIEFTVSLKATLETLGMREIFNKKTANFGSLFTGTGDFSISDVVHNAFIEVNETGTEASAFTDIKVEFNRRVVRQIIFEFNVNHPFYFALLDNDTVYFAGHIVDI